jgi:UPF0755 protein
MLRWYFAASSGFMRKTLPVFFFCFVLLLIGIIIWLSIAFYNQSISSQKKPLIFRITQGESTTEIVEKLKNQGIRPQTHYLLLLAKWSGKLKQIKAGEYSIPSDATPKQLLEKLRKGQVVLHKITFPEGITFEQMLKRLASESALSHALNNLDDKAIMAEIGHSGEYPEGLFYPDTYLFSLHATDKQILKLSYRLMQKKLMQAWTSRASDLPYKTPYQALIVASLIEKETKKNRERPIVASVILRRLEIGMRLQIDAAVLYGLSGQDQLVLRHSDLTIDTPYNTYTNNGLPPTPIAMPGMASIQAALHPALSKALYYVAKGDGSHIFSNTLQEHNIAVKAYRKRVGAIDNSTIPAINPRFLFGLLNCQQPLIAHSPSRLTSDKQLSTSFTDVSLQQCYSVQLMWHLWQKYAEQAK